MTNAEGGGPPAGERPARLTEPRGSERLRLLVRLGQEAGRVLEDLGHRLPDSVAAWRFLPSTLNSPSQKEGQLSDVVQSLRSAEAVVDLVEVRERWATGPLRERAERIIADAEQISLKKLRESVQPELEGSATQIRVPYSVASLVSFRARCECAREREDDEPPAELPKNLTKALTRQIDLTLGLSAGDDAERQAHPFLLYHLMRAVVLSEYCGARMPEAKKRLANQLREVTERLLARTVLRTGSDAEGVALTFCAAALSLSTPEKDRPHIEAALESAADCQEQSGCWAQGCNAGSTRDPDTGAALEISTYEVALALAEATLGMTRSDQTGARPIPPAAVDSLWRALTHVDLTRRQIASDESPNEGWSGCQIYGRAEIEALASANVLSLTVRFQQLIDDIARHELMPTYELEDPRTEFWPKWLEWETYKTKSEPDSKNKILEYLDREVVAAAVESRRGKPYPWARARQITVLLFGPPGTTKTTIVRAVAEGLDWPLITLGPGDFVQEGLERVEARADLIFSELHSLSRTVVLFDECDELFRERKPSQGNDQVRGIAAFVTASMLPKLQELHDRGQIVLFILTNHFATMDPAIKRLGRVDHIIGVGPPDAAQRTVILQKAFDDELSKEDRVPAKIVEAVIDAISYADPHFIRSELLRIASQVAGSLRDAEKLTIAIARELAHEIVEKQATPTVNDDQYKEFEQQRLEASLHA
jgi:hypothetical protein